MSKRMNIMAMALAVGMVGVACSSDGDKKTGGGTEEPKVSAAFCDATVKLNTAFNEAPQDPEAIKTYYEDTVKGLVADVQAAAPADLTDDLEVLEGALKTFVDTADFTAFETPEATKAEDALDEELLAGCDGEKLTVSAVDYAFEGVPATVATGRTWIRFSNDGDELHEMAMMRKNDGVTESFQEVLELPEEEARKKVTFVVGAYAKQGEWDGIPVDLTAGEYALLCFVPVGSVDPEEEVDGPPHFTKGMITEFTAA